MQSILSHRTVFQRQNYLEIKDMTGLECILRKCPHIYSVDFKIIDSNQETYRQVFDLIYKYFINFSCLRAVGFNLSSDSIHIIDRFIDRYRYVKKFKVMSYSSNNFEFYPIFDLLDLISRLNHTQSQFNYFIKSNIY